MTHRKLKCLDNLDQLKEIKPEHHNDGLSKSSPRETYIDIKSTEGQNLVVFPQHSRWQSKTTRHQFKYPKPSCLTPMFKHSNEEVNIQCETKNSKIIDANSPNPKPVRVWLVWTQFCQKRTFFSSHSCQILAHKELSDWWRGKYSRGNSYS